MKKGFSILIVSTVIIGIAISLVGMTFASQTTPELQQKVRKIVVFQEETFRNEPDRNGLLKKFDAETLKELPLINGVAVLLPPKAKKALSKQAGVLRIDNDDLVFALGKPSNPGKKPKKEKPQPDEEMAWGVNRIDADHIWLAKEDWDNPILPVCKADANTGEGIKVAIIDSGIDLDHPDLHVAGGYNAINSKKSWNDDYRHGTHVAGIVAALDNEIGVIGTASKVELYAVKVLNRRGIGFASDIIDGLQWCIDNGIQVANMSIGSSGSSQSYHDAIKGAYNAGITIVAAAGNNGEDDGSIVWPARWPETIAVSATCSNTKSPDTCKTGKAIIMDSNGEDGLAYFSSYASSTDNPGDDSSVVSINLLSGPGEDINSTWNDGYYHEGSGTSMATPHVTGAVALVLKAKGCTSQDRLVDGCMPDDIINLLQTNGVEDLGPAGTDRYFGYGLIDVEEAVNSVVTP